MQLLDGKVLAEKIENNLKEVVGKMQKRPVLAMFLIGDDVSSQIYIAKKKESCKKVGIESREIILEETVSQEELIKEIEKLNLDPYVNGILVQLPLPKNFDEMRIIETISPAKDVDCLHPLNYGRFTECKKECLPLMAVTPRGVMQLLSAYKISIQGKHAVIVGYSNIVGKPLVHAFVSAGATVTICHRKTIDLAEHLSRADIVIVAVGKPNLIKADMLKAGSVVVDVGINRMADGKVRGDVDFDSVKEKVAYITPVPGGIGPLTVALLLQRTVELAQLQKTKSML